MKKVITTMLVAAMVLSMAVPTSAATITRKKTASSASSSTKVTGDYSLKMVDKTLQFVRGGKVVSSIDTKDAKVTLRKNSKGGISVVFTDSKGKRRNITLGAQDSVSLNGTFVQVSVDKALGNSFEVTLEKGSKVTSLYAKGAAKVIVNGTATTLNATASNANVTVNGTVTKAYAVSKGSISGLPTSKITQTSTGTSSSGSITSSSSSSSSNNSWGNSSNTGGSVGGGVVGEIIGGGTTNKPSVALKTVSLKQTIATVPTHDQGTKLSTINPETVYGLKATYNGATVAGKFSFSAANGTVLTGENSYSVMFTPTQGSVYNKAYINVKINGKAVATPQTLAQAKAAVESVIAGLGVNNDTTEAGILAAAKAVISNTSIETTSSITVVKATEGVAGSVKGTITLKLNGVTETVAVDKAIAALPTVQDADLKAAKAAIEALKNKEYSGIGALKEAIKAEAAKSGVDVNLDGLSVLDNAVSGDVILSKAGVTETVTVPFTATVATQTLAEAKAAIEAVLGTLVVTNDTTAAGIIAEAKKVVTNKGIADTIIYPDFALVKATESAEGTIKGNITIKDGASSAVIVVELKIAKLQVIEDANIKAAKAAIEALLSTAEYADLDAAKAAIQKIATANGVTIDDKDVKLSADGKTISGPVVISKTGVTETATAQFSGTVKVPEGEAKTPTFTKHPTSTASEITLSKTNPTVLTVAADVDGKTDGITYQWYRTLSNSATDTGTNAKRTKIEGATSESYTLDTEDVGTYNFFCEAKQTVGGKESAPAYSNLLALTVKVPAGSATMPTFTTQPESATVVLGATKILSVVVDSVAGNAPTYQWYVSTDPANPHNGTKIEGETAASLTILNKSAGVSYYYCEATNSTTGTGEFSKLTAKSKTAKITVKAVVEISSMTAITEDSTVGTTGITVTFDKDITGLDVSNFKLEGAKHADGSDCTITLKNVISYLNDKKVYTLEFNGAADEDHKVKVTVQNLPETITLTGDKFKDVDVKKGIPAAVADAKATAMEAVAPATGKETTQVKVTFDKAFNVAPATSAFELKLGSTSGTAATISKAELDPANKAIVILTFTYPAANSDTEIFLTKANALTPDTTLEATLVRDTAAPKVSDVRYFGNNANKVNVTFDKALADLTEANFTSLKGDFSITDADGKDFTPAITISSAEFDATSGNTAITLTLGTTPTVEAYVKYTPASNGGVLKSASSAGTVVGSFTKKIGGALTVETLAVKEAMVTASSNGNSIESVTAVMNSNIAVEAGADLKTLFKVTDTTGKEYTVTSVEAEYTSKARSTPTSKAKNALKITFASPQPAAGTVLKIAINSSSSALDKVKAADATGAAIPNAPVLKPDAPTVSTASKPIATFKPVTLTGVPETGDIVGKVTASGGTAPYTYALVEAPTPVKAALNADKFEIDKDGNIKVIAEATLTANTKYTVYVEVTDNTIGTALKSEKLECNIVVGDVKELTATFTPVTSFTAVPVKAGTEVGTVTADGGSGTKTFAIATGKGNDKFEIADGKVKVLSSLSDGLPAGDHKFTVTVTDESEPVQTKDVEFTLTVGKVQAEGTAAADYEGTEIKVTLSKGAFNATEAVTSAAATATNWILTGLGEEAKNPSKVEIAEGVATLTVTAIPSTKVANITVTPAAAVFDANTTATTSPITVTMTPVEATATATGTVGETALTVTLSAGSFDTGDAAVTSGWTVTLKPTAVVQQTTEVTDTTATVTKVVIDDTGKKATITLGETDTLAAGTVDVTIPDAAILSTTSVATKTVTATIAEKTV